MWSRYVFAVLFGLALSASNECKSVAKRSRPASLIRNDEPIIGILTQELSSSLKKNFGSEYGSYIAASYVKFLEGSGARVVPIWIGQPHKYYSDIMRKLNGVLLPGGATFFNNTEGYAEAGMTIYQIAEEMNNGGTYMPLWGTCLGMELILYAATNGKEHRTDCNSVGQLLPLEFERHTRKSRKLFSDAPTDVLNALSNQNVTYNYHRYCTTQDTFEKLGLSDDWRILSTNEDFNGVEFISAVEHKRFPFYNVQFHPEKNSYEWSSNKVFPHSAEAIRVSQYFGDFFVNECRKNMNRFDTETEKLDSLIQNYSPVFSGRKISTYYQMYLFEPRPRYGNELEISANLV